ncbi:MAG: CCDC174 family protein [Smithellaceae bacterium]
MSLLTVGVVTAIFGLISLIFWWADFLAIIRGALPLFLLLSGALAIYVGFDEIQDKIREERQRQDEELEKAREDIESARAEAERYKEELDKLKNGKNQT